jgi:hypothetical protein
LDLRGGINCIMRSVMVSSKDLLLLLLLLLNQGGFDG